MRPQSELVEKLFIKIETSDQLAKLKLHGCMEGDKPSECLDQEDELKAVWVDKQLGSVDEEVKKICEAPHTLLKKDNPDPCEGSFPAAQFFFPIFFDPQ